jgi:hypothetical protein
VLAAEVLFPRAARITGGTVEIDGVDVTAASEDRRRERDVSFATAG